MLQWPAAAGRASTLSNSPMRLGERVRGRCTVGRRRAGVQRAVVGGGAKGVNGGKASDERGTRRACLWQILWGPWAAGWAMLPCNTKIAWAERASVGERALRSEFGRSQVQEASSSRQQ